MRHAVSRHYCHWLVFLLFLPSLVGHAADRRPKHPLSGQEIFRQQCVKCHGRAGEGVKGKYNDALTGDWSVEKLSRYISKNMPDDNPGACVGRDADAVARFIHETFYSREARWRNHPARVELARLTNRQYLHAVADLLRHFGSDKNVKGTEQGLRGTYYNARGFNQDKKIFDRLDPAIHFDFGQGSPEEGKIGREEFSMQWRGSIFAEESGDYTFVLKTPNGARLSINDEEKPLIDAWVASGEMSEHRATVRLLGGRFYPLQLDYFKFKDKSASVSLQWKPPHSALVPVPQRNLSPERTRPTFVVTTPFPPDDSSVGYERGVSISREWDEAVSRAAVETANYVVKHLDSLSRSKPDEEAREKKVALFCEEFVSTAFRRPLSDEQKQSFIFSRLKKAPRLEEGVKRVILFTLNSPRFLYLGLPHGAVDDFDIAERLSFALWDSLPDPSLLAAAKNGELHAPDQVSARAAQMLADPRAHAKVQYFFHHWLQMNQVDDLSKDLQLYPQFTPEIAADLRTSLDLFLEQTFWSPSSDYRDLLLADYLFLNQRMAGFYGVTWNEPDGTNNFVRARMDPGQRSGVITHPYLLAEFSYQKSSSPIHRGVFLTRNIVGRALKPPPMAMTFKDSDFSPHLTMREKVASLTQSSACQTCHSVINPLGFSLESYDAVGRFRTQENDRPINPASDYVTDDGRIVHFTGARDVAEFAASSEQAQTAFIEQLFHQVVKQPILAYGPTVSERLHQSFVDSHFNMQKLLVDIATLSALYQPEKPAPSNRRS